MRFWAVRSRCVARRASRWRLTAGLAAALVLACRETSEFVTAPEMEPGELGFYVVLHGREILDLEGPFELDRPPARQNFLLARDPIRVLFVAIDVSTLRARVPELDANRMHELHLEPRSPDCAEVLHRGEARSVPLDDELARVLVLDDSTFVSGRSADTGLSLVASVEAEGCFAAAAPTVSPFVPGGELWPSEVVIGPELWSPEDERSRRSLTRAVPLVGGRVAVMSSKMIAEVSRDQAWNNAPSQYWQIWALGDAVAHDEPGTDWALEEFARDETRTSSAAVVLILLLKLNARGAGAVRSMVAELVWTPEGFGPGRVVLDDGPMLHGVGNLPDGRVLLVGDLGTVLVSTFGAADFTAVPNPGIPRGALRGSTLQSDPREPVVLLQADGALLFGDPGQGPTFRQEPSPVFVTGPRALLTVSAADGDHLFSDTHRYELMHRRPGGERGLDEVPVPDALPDCGSPPDACGRRFARGARPTIAATPWGTLLVRPLECASLIELEPRTGCVRAVPGLESLAETGALDRLVLGTASLADRVLLLGPAGRALVLE